MQDSPSNQVEYAIRPTKTSRRAVVSWAAKLAGGAALAASVPGAPWVQRAAAQDDEIILTASASEVGARPGGAYANGAAARAVADHEAGSSTQGAGSFSPAPAVGGPGSGAGPGDQSGAGPGNQTGTGPGGGGGGGGGGGTGAGPGDSSGAGPGDQSGGGGY